VKHLTRRTLLASIACVALSAQAQDWFGRVPPAGVGGALDLVDQRGQRFALQRLAGRPVLVFFGFTQCGSTCPVALATARQVLHASPPGQDPAVVFVTLDPLTDGPQQLRTFIERIDARIIGLTGSPHQIEQAAERYGVGVRGNAAPLALQAFPPGGTEHLRSGRAVTQARTLEHSSMIYLLDGAGRVRRVYPHTTPADSLMADIRRLQALEG
jgi:protein SCO1/2